MRKMLELFCRPSLPPSFFGSESLTPGMRERSHLADEDRSTSPALPHWSKEVAAYAEVSVSSRQCRRNCFSVFFLQSQSGGEHAPGSTQIMSPLMFSAHLVKSRQRHSKRPDERDLHRRDLRWRRCAQTGSGRPASLVHDRGKYRVYFLTLALKEHSIRRFAETRLARRLGGRSCFRWISASVRECMCLCVCVGED